MKPRIWIPAVAALLLAGAGIATWLHNYHRVSRWVDLPRTGEAATDPLYALRLVLEAQGRRVTSARRLDSATLGLSRRDTVVFDGDPRTLTPRVRDALLAWLRRGGHLVIALPPPDPAGDVFVAGASTHVSMPVIDALGLRVRRTTPQGCVRGVGLPKELCDTRRMDAAGRPRLRAGDAGGDVFARMRLPGGGTADVFGSLAFLSTDNLERPDARALAAQVFAADDPRGRVHLVHADSLPSLFRTLVVHGWPVWLPLALLLAGALWSRMRRFGPLLPSPVAERRSLLEHVAASGRHAWRYRRADTLHDAMREAFLERLRRRDPQLAALEGEPRIVGLVERFGLPAPAIRDALAPSDPRDAKAFVARIATLVRMGNRL